MYRLCITSHNHHCIITITIICYLHPSSSSPSSSSSSFFVFKTILDIMVRISCIPVMIIMITCITRHLSQHLYDCRSFRRHDHHAVCVWLVTEVRGIWLSGLLLTYVVSRCDSNSRTVAFASAVFVCRSGLYGCPLCKYEHIKHTIRRHTHMHTRTHIIEQFRIVKHEKLFDGSACRVFTRNQRNNV